MRANVNRDKIESNLVADVKKNLPGNKLTLASSLALVNGMAIMYKRAMEDFSPAEKMVLDTKMKEVIYQRFLVQSGGSIHDYNRLLDEYFALLPAEFTSKLDTEFWKKEKFGRRELEREVSRLSYRTLERMVDHQMKETEENFPDPACLKGAIADYKATQRLLKKGLALKIVYSKGFNGIDAVEEYLDTLVKKIVECEVDYCGSMSDYVLRFYSTIEVDRELAQHNEDDYLQIGSDEEIARMQFGSEEVERG